MFQTIRTILTSLFISLTAGLIIYHFGLDESQQMTVRTSAPVVMVLGPVVYYEEQTGEFNDESDLLTDSGELNDSSEPTESIVQEPKKAESEPKISETVKQDVNKASEDEELLALNIGHAQQSDNCFKPESFELKEAGAEKIYQWTDENGVVHFSDKSASDNAEFVGDKYKDARKLFNLNVEFVGGTIDYSLQDMLQGDAYWVYDRHRELLDPKILRLVNLNITIYNDFSEFQNLLYRTMGSTNWGAFYSPADNRLYIYNDPSRRWQVQAIARHEISHAVLQNLLGTVPIWLNEGLAEYMSTKGQDFGWDVKLDRDYLIQLLKMTRQQFYNESTKNRNYRAAHKLIHKLMTEPEGRGYIKGLFKYWGNNPCEPLDMVLYTRESYPGGPSALARNL